MSQNGEAMCYKLSSTPSELPFCIGTCIGICLCTAYLRSCHSISIRLISGVWQQGQSKALILGFF